MSSFMKQTALIKVRITDRSDSSLVLAQRQPGLLAHSNLKIRGCRHPISCKYCYSTVILVRVPHYANW